MVKGESEYKSYYAKCFLGLFVAYRYQKLLQIHLTVNTFEVTIRRNTKGRHCNEDWKNDDDYVFEQSRYKSKCRASYQNWNTSLSYCDTKDKMAKAALRIEDRSKCPPPCRSAEKVSYEYGEVDIETDTTKSNHHESFSWTGFETLDLMNEDDNDTVTILVYLPSPMFKIILHKKAYDLQALIGNCGGYIGLILGTSL